MDSITNLFFDEYLEPSPDSKIYKINLIYKLNEFLFRHSLDTNNNLFDLDQDILKDLFNMYEIARENTRGARPGAVSARKVVKGLKWKENISIKYKYKN